LVADRKADGPAATAPPPTSAVAAPAPPPQPEAEPEKPTGRKRRRSKGKAASGDDANANPGVEGVRHTGRLLGNLLVTRGFVLESELQYALSLQGDSGQPIGQILVQLGLISERDLVELLAEQRRMQVLDPARVDCDAELLARLPKADAHRLNA